MTALAELAAHLAARASDLVGSLAEVAAADPVPTVRLQALRTLAQDDPERARPLLEAAATGDDLTTRAGALLHLGRTDSLADTLRAVPEGHLHLLLTTLSAGTPAQVAIAVAALGDHLLPEPVWFALTAAAAARPAPEVRRAVVDALPHQAVGGRAVFATDRAAVALCGDPSPEVQEVLLPLLGSLDGGLEEVVGWLSERGRRGGRGDRSGRGPVRLRPARPPRGRAGGHPGAGGRGARRPRGRRHRRRRARRGRARPPRGAVGDPPDAVSVRQRGGPCPEAASSLSRFFGACAR